MSFRAAFFSYLNLSRLNRPIAIFLLWIPCMMGLLIARVFCFQKNGWQIFHDPVFWKDCFIFTSGSIIMRTSGCIMNDIWDARIDKHVQRTKQRPLATGALNKAQALVFFVLISGIGLIPWCYLTFQARVCSIIFFFLGCLYPLAKRVTHFPQLILGLTWNGSFFVAVLQTFGSFTHSSLKIGWLFLIYSALIFWTLAYDTIYAFLDLKDDLVIGVKSTAVYFKKTPVAAVTGFYGVSLVCWLLLGIIAESSALWWSVYCITVLCVGFLLLKWSKQHTMVFFKVNIYIGFLFMLLCFLLDIKSH